MSRKVTSVVVLIAFVIALLPRQALASEIYVASNGVTVEELLVPYGSNYKAYRVAYNGASVKLEQSGTDTYQRVEMSGNGKRLIIEKWYTSNSIGDPVLDRTTTTYAGTAVTRYANQTLISGGPCTIDYGCPDRCCIPTLRRRWT